MSLNVKEWQPAEGCKSCKQAARLFHEHTKIAAHTNSLAVNRIRELEAKVAALRQWILVAGVANDICTYDIIKKCDNCKCWRAKEKEPEHEQANE